MEVWIGLAHVKPKPGNGLLDGAKGAFVPVLAWASNADEFVSRAMDLIGGYDFHVVEIEDIESFKTRLARSPIDKDVVALASSINKDNTAAFASFEAYEDI